MLQHSNSHVRVVDFFVAVLVFEERMKHHHLCEVAPDPDVVVDDAVDACCEMMIRQQSHRGDVPYHLVPHAILPWRRSCSNGHDRDHGCQPLERWEQLKPLYPPQEAVRVPYSLRAIASRLIVENS